MQCEDKVEEGASVANSTSAQLQSLLPMMMKQLGVLQLLLDWTLAVVPTIAREDTSGISLSSFNCAH